MAVFGEVQTEKRLGKERIYLYDNIKFVAILLVVVGHSIGIIPEVANGNWLEKSLFTAIYSFHMPLFIFLSGLFVKPMDKSTKFPKQRVISFILIGVIIRVFMSLLRLILNMKPSYGVLDMYDTYAWFMWAMAIWLVITWIFREYDTKIILLLSLVVGCMAGLDKNLGDKLVLMRIIVFLPFFLIGYMLTPDGLLKLLSKRWLKITAVFVIAGLMLYFLLSHDVYTVLKPLFTGRNTFDFLKASELNNFGIPLRMLCYVISASLAVSVMCLIPNRNFGFITKMGTKTLQIYFWHRLILTVFESFKVYDKFEAHLGGTVASTLMVIIGVAITFLCALPIFEFPTKQLLLFGKPKATTEE